MSASSASTSAAADPRRPDSIVEYKPEVKRIEDDDPDVHGFVALCTAVVGLMIRAKSYLNQRASEGGLMGSPAATIVFSISTLVMNYMPEILAFYSGFKV